MSTVTAERLRIPTDGLVLEGSFEVPPRPRGVVVMARDGVALAPASRCDPEAQVLVDCGFATLVLALLSADERGDPRRGLDVFRLARRLEAAADVVARHPHTWSLPIGYVGDGPGAAGALLASLDDPRVGAIICRRGRPDLAEGILDRVTVPTLLMVDGSNQVGVALNTAALARLCCLKELVTVTPCTDHVREAGTRGIAVCSRWFLRYLGEPGSTAVCQEVAKTPGERGRRDVIRVGPGASDVRAVG